MRAFSRAATVLGLLATAASVSAVMVEEMALERVATEAARIVHARVIEVRAGRDAAGLPATWVTLDVARTLKGSATSRLTIKQYGVSAPLPDGTLARVPGLPAYAAGEETVLFLRGESHRGFTSPAGLGQGVYRVERAADGPRVRSDLAAAGSGGAPESLDAFLAKVERLVAGE